jgi:hypothetical protein
MYQFIKSSEAQNQEVPPSPAQESQPKKSGDWKVLTNFDIAGEFHILGEDELRASKLSFTELKEKLGSLNCEYTVFVRVFGRNSGTQVPVTVAAITNPESEKDIMALRVNNYADLIQQAQLPVETFEAINPAAVLMKPAVTAEAELGETVYPTGFGGFQPFVEECYVSARPKNTNNYPYAGLKEPYTLRCSPDYGFSGGPVLNAKGQVIGISKSKTDNFLLVVSQKDIEDVLKAMDRIEKEAKDKAEKDKK